MKSRIKLTLAAMYSKGAVLIWKNLRNQKCFVAAASKPLKKINTKETDWVDKNIINYEHQIDTKDIRIPEDLAYDWVIDNFEFSYQLFQDNEEAFEFANNLVNQLKAQGLTYNKYFKVPKIQYA